MGRKSTVMLAVLLLACGGDPAPPPWTAVAPDALEDADRAALETAKGAAGELGRRLMMELGAALAESGPAGAVAVCRDRAPALSEVVGRELGVRIGRTSHLLRNAENRPPEWAVDIVAAIPGDPGAARSPRVFRGPEGRYGVTLPIEMKAFCVTCHGSDERIPEAVRGQLAETYPEDRARGFAEGDLRGLFWVELP